MAIADQYKLLRDSGYEPGEAADLLAIDDPDALEAAAASSPKSSSTWTPYERYVSNYSYIYRRDLDEDPDLSSQDRDLIAQQTEPGPYDPDLDASGYYQRSVDEYLDELESEYAAKLEQQRAS